MEQDRWDEAHAPEAEEVDVAARAMVAAEARGAGVADVFGCGMAWACNRPKRRLPRAPLLALRSALGRWSPSRWSQNSGSRFSN